MTYNTIFITLNGNSKMHDIMKMLKTLVHVSKPNMPSNHLIGMDGQDEVLEF
jgi:hypothetical protein